MKPQNNEQQKNNLKRMSKNILFGICGLLLLTGCSSSDDAPTPPAAPSFTFDNSTYSLLGAQGITEARMQHVFDIDGVFYNRSSITLIGLIGFSKTATVSFDLYYKDGMSVGGTYTIYQEEDDNMVDFQDYMVPLNRACMGWTTAGYAVNMSNSDETSANNPSGTVKITVNSPTNYTIQYSGNFRVYVDGFTFVRNAPTAINVTGTVEIHDN